MITCRNGGPYSSFSISSLIYISHCRGLFINLVQFYSIKFLLFQLAAIYRNIYNDDGRYSCHIRDRYKKVIALSTLRQLGIIIIVLGAQIHILSFFHLLAHTYFKAILFMCAGIIIHNIKDYQDIRNMGRGGLNIPVTMRVIAVANLRLCGFPFLRGFYSKDIILEFIIFKNLRIFYFVVILLSTFLTLTYSLRLSFFLIVNPIKNENFLLVSDNDIFILAGIFILFPFAVWGGINLSWAIFRYTPVIFMPP